MRFTRSRAWISIPGFGRSRFGLSIPVMDLLSNGATSPRRSRQPGVLLVVANKSGKIRIEAAADSAWQPEPLEEPAIAWTAQVKSEAAPAKPFALWPHLLAIAVIAGLIWLAAHLFG